MITVIHDLAERVAIAAVTKAHGPVDEKFQARFRHNFQAFQLGALLGAELLVGAKGTQIPDLRGARHCFPRGTRSGVQRFGSDQRSLWPATAAVAGPASGTSPCCPGPCKQTRDGTRRSARNGKTPFTKWRRRRLTNTSTHEVAPNGFWRRPRRQRPTGVMPATERLTDAITASIAAIAAWRKGWPHSNDMDIANAVTSFMGDRAGHGANAGAKETADLYELMQSASEQGQDLFSAFGAAMGQPDAVRFAYRAGHGANAGRNRGPLRTDAISLGARTRFIQRFRSGNGTTRCGTVRLRSADGSDDDASPRLPSNLPIE